MVAVSSRQHQQRLLLQHRNIGTMDNRIGSYRVPHHENRAVAVVLLAVLAGCQAVDVHFENPDSGFFLRAQEGTLGVGGSGSSIGSVGVGRDGGVLAVERFTVLDPTRAALIRATYGPFSTKQTIPARYILPDLDDEQQVTNGTSGRDAPAGGAGEGGGSGSGGAGGSGGDRGSSSSGTGASGASSSSSSSSSSPKNNIPPTPYPGHHQLEVSAHLVTSEVSRDRPVIRVLVHGAGARGHHSPHVCVTVMARCGSDMLSSSCTPGGEGETGGDGTCLAELLVPARWWPPHTRNTIKLPRTLVQVSYLVGTAAGPDVCGREGGSTREALGSTPRVTVQPETPVGEVLLHLAAGGYEELSQDPLLHLLVPRAPLYPASLVHVPLYLQPAGNQPALVFVQRCKVRGGIRIVGVEAASSAWNLTEEINSRRTTATVTALLANPAPDNATLHNLGLHEVLSWVLEVPEDGEVGEAKVVWTLRYLMDALRHETFAGGDTRRMTAKLTVLKDEIQAVLPIAKSWSVVNTAVLTGRQVSRAMKVLIVSWAGQVADVTLQSSCSCTDVAALKVSSSCTSVYLDGSEVRGSYNATVVVEYGDYTGRAAFTVWMPELPLAVFLPDTKLSQVKGWKTPDHTHTYRSKLANQADNATAGDDDPKCSLRYQQTQVEVYGRFVAVDDNSGRESYLMSRRTEVRVTELVTHLLRVADTSVATLQDTTVRGRQPGRTEVQVLSPITGRVIGAQEVRVGSEKVWVSRLRAAVISGLQLSLQPDPHLSNGYSAITAVTPTLTAKYQEGLVDVAVEFSDGVVTPLREMRISDYNLHVQSVNPSVVAVAPSPHNTQPRVIAIGHGSGDLIKVSLEISSECQRRRVVPLVSTVVHVKVDLGPASTPPPHTRNGGNRQVHLSELPHADDAAPHDHFGLLNAAAPHLPTVQARLHPPRHALTALEVSMYILLAVFCVAIVAFVTSCVVYTSRLRKPPGPRGATSNYDSVTNAHDWVWLGRATLERASGIGLTTSPGGVNNGSSSASGVMKSDLNGNSSSGGMSGIAGGHSGWRDRKFGVGTGSSSSGGYDRVPGSVTSSSASSASPAGAAAVSDSIHITTNPHFDAVDVIQPNVTFIENPHPLELPSQSPAPAYETSSTSKESQHLRFNGSTFTRSRRSNRRVTFNNLNEESEQDGEEDEEEEEEDRPPVPPHRNIGVTANINHGAAQQPPASAAPAAPAAPAHDQPPPIPPHGLNIITNPFEGRYSPNHSNHNHHHHHHPVRQHPHPHHHHHHHHHDFHHHHEQFQQQEEEPDENLGDKAKDLPDPRFVEVNADDFVRLRGVCRGRASQVKRATILENPLLSQNFPENFNITAQDPEALENLPTTMDYDQLMEYFNNLKESNA